VEAAAGGGGGGPISLRFEESFGNFVNSAVFSFIAPLSHAHPPPPESAPPPACLDRVRGEIVATRLKLEQSYESRFPCIWEIPK
jgi:hypothetical protein